MDNCRAEVFEDSLRKVYKGLYDHLELSKQGEVYNDFGPIDNQVFRLLIIIKNSARDPL